MLPPPAPTFLTATDDRPVMWPVNIGPSHVSRVSCTSRSRTTLTSKLVPPVSQTTRFLAAGATRFPATGAMAGPEFTE